MAREIIMVGNRFGRLTVIEYAGLNRRNSKMWICKCDCGNITKPIISSSLRNGNTRSCGCLNGTHHKKNTRLYSIWQGMKARCYRPSHQWYKRYGGRGITICDEWKNDFQAFYDWAMENGYADNLTIDRKDNDRGYCPENCQFTSQTSQIRNRSISITVVVNGVEKTLQQLSEETGIKYRTLHRRYEKGCDITELLKPVKATQGGAI